MKLVKAPDFRANTLVRNAFSFTRQPLSREESQHLVEKVLLRVEDLPDQLRDLIIEYAECDPFCLEELIKMLVEDGVIFKDEPNWQVRAGRMEEITIHKR